MAMMSRALDASLSAGREISKSLSTGKRGITQQHTRREVRASQPAEREVLCRQHFQPTAVRSTSLRKLFLRGFGNSCESFTHFIGPSAASTCLSTTTQPNHLPLSSWQQQTTTTMGKRTLETDHEETPAKGRRFTATSSMGGHRHAASPEAQGVTTIAMASSSSSRPTSSD
eukprot:scaffold2031_cov185-Alexandrium_tamarense.AAC.1